MKTLRKMMGFGVIAFAIFAFNACSSKDSTEVPSSGQEVTFQLDAKTVMETKAAIAGYTECNDTNIPLQVSIVLSGTEDVVISDEPVNLFGDNYKTAPILLKSGEYTVESVTVYNGTTVIYSGVKAPAEFATFIPDGYLMGEQKFTVTDYTKPTVPLYVLCAKGEPANKFGMPKFQINRIEVNCFDLFFNVCDPTKGNEHEVGTGMISVYDKVDGNLLYSDEFGEGNIATLCFANDLTKLDAEEVYYIEVVLNNSFLVGTPVTLSGNATVEQLLKYKEASNWDEDMNAIHVQYCGQTTFCLLPGLICDICETQLYEDFERYSDINQFYEKSGWLNLNGGEDMLLRHPEDNQWMLAIGNDREFMWKTVKFAYTSGDVVSLDAFVKSYAKEWNKWDAVVTLALADEDGNIIEGTMKDIKMSSPCGHASWTTIPRCGFTPEVESGCYRLYVKVKLAETCIGEYYFGMDNVSSIPKEI
ncbi:MAG: hypothetical protein ACRC6R_08235 [Bacteroidales bacterium]